MNLLTGVRRRLESRLTRTLKSVHYNVAQAFQPVGSRGFPASYCKIPPMWLSQDAPRQPELNLESPRNSAIVPDGGASGEMADTPDLGSGPVRGGGSSPLSRTMNYAIPGRERLFANSASAMKTSFIIRLVAATVLITLGCIGWAEAISTAVLLFSISWLLLIPRGELTRPIPRSEWWKIFLLIAVFVAVMLTLVFLHLPTPSQTVRVAMAVPMWVLGMWTIYLRWQQARKSS